MIYHVRLTQFEGPLDLLLHLIRRDKINIYDIPIAHITREYLATIELMRELDLEVAGEFFVMAATLMRIKAQMLLPRRPSESEEEIDPREELVRNLLEYKKFKEAAFRLAEHEEDRRLVFTRPAPAEGAIEAEEEAEEPGVTVFDLMEAFRKVLEDYRKQAVYRVDAEKITTEERMAVIRGRLEERPEVLFTELFSGASTRIEIIVTFLAVLELVKGGELIARQMDSNGDIWLYRPGVGSYVHADDKPHDE